MGGEEEKQEAPVSVSENSDLRGLCSAGLQAGTLESSTCPPEGRRYMNQAPVLTEGLKPATKHNPNGRAEARPSQKAQSPKSGQWRLGQSLGVSLIFGRRTLHGFYEARGFFFHAGQPEREDKDRLESGSGKGENGIRKSAPLNGARVRHPKVNIGQRLGQLPKKRKRDSSLRSE